MTTINSVTQSGLGIGRTGLSALSMDPIRALLARKMSGSAADAASFSGALRPGTGLASIDGARRSLDEVAGLLGQLKEQVGKLTSGGADRADVQGAIDELVESIDDAALRSGMGGGTSEFTVEGIAGQLKNVMVHNVRLAPGQEQRVEIDVRASAQQAGLFMDLADGRLRLGQDDARFTIELGGRGGMAEFNFRNGASAEEIAADINARAKETGVEARLSGNGIRLESRVTGSSEFVSVKVIDDGGASDEAGYFYRMEKDNVKAADPDLFMTFDSPVVSKGISDNGQDAEVWVNGEQAAVYGSQVLVNSENFTALFFLSRDMQADTLAPNAQRLGKFTGFTITAEGPVATSGTGGDGKTPRTSAPDGSETIDPVPGPTAAGGTPVPPKRPDGDKDEAPETTVPATRATDGLRAAAAGPEIDPESIRGEIEKLVQRIRGQAGVLDLVEQVGLSVVPASVGGIAAFGSGGSLDFPSALDMARAIRGGEFGGGRMGDLVGGLTSGQALRLLGGDGVR